MLKLKDNRNCSIKERIEQIYVVVHGQKPSLCTPAVNILTAVSSSRTSRKALERVLRDCGNCMMKSSREVEVRFDSKTCPSKRPGSRLLFDDASPINNLLYSKLHIVCSRQRRLRHGESQKILLTTWMCCSLCFSVVELRIVL